ncbi:MAG: hypothetical protein SNJ57_12035 [Cyanobacteriota bacterium]
MFAEIEHWKNRCKKGRSPCTVAARIYLLVSQAGGLSHVLSLNPFGWCAVLAARTILPSLPPECLELRWLGGLHTAEGDRYHYFNQRCVLSLPPRNAFGCPRFLEGDRHN